MVRGGLKRFEMKGIFVQYQGPPPALRATPASGGYALRTSSQLCEIYPPAGDTLCVLLRGFARSTRSGGYVRFAIADCPLPIAHCRLTPIAHYHLTPPAPFFPHTHRPVFCTFVNIYGEKGNT